MEDVQKKFFWNYNNMNIKNHINLNIFLGEAPEKLYRYRKNIDDEL